MDIQMVTKEGKDVIMHLKIIGKIMLCIWKS